MKKFVLIFPKDSEAIFNKNSKCTFGGATVQMFLLAKELRTYYDFETYSFINKYSEIDYFHNDEFNLIKTFNESDNIFKKILIFHKKIKKLKPDIIIQRGLTLFSCLLALYCNINKISFVFMFAHDREVEGRYQRSEKRCSLFRLLLAYSDFLIFQNQYQMNRIDEKYKFKSKIIYSGYEINSCHLKLKETVLWISRLEEWKRPELFIQLARKNPEKQFVMIAPESPGYAKVYNKIIEEVVDIENLQYIDFVPFQEIDYYFKKARIFVNTSIQEGFPNTFIQACKYGTPVISLNVNPDGFIDKHSCGFFCKDDFNLMNEKLNTILKNDDIYAELSKNAFNYSLMHHDIKRNVKDLIEFIC